jgi:hypothetical protein
MKWVLWILLVLVAAFLIAGVLQHLRYLDIRRDLAMDNQEMLYASESLHVVTVLKLETGQDLLDGVGAFVEATEAQGASVVYAGRIAVNALKSAQIPPEEWDAFVLAQFPSRADYDAASAEPVYQAARSQFRNSYSLGMHRPAPLNLGLPIMFLGLRILDVITLEPARFPFTAVEVPERYRTPEAEERERLVGSLRASGEFGRDACVVLNFIKDGNAEQQAANAGYGRAMTGLMAETGSGPMHIGPAVTLEGGADFDQVAIVFYPGTDFFADMIESEFYTGISGGKQLGDTLASPSVPLLPHL